MCLVAVLINKNKATTLAKIEGTNKQQQSTVGTETMLNSFTYTIDEDNKTVTLNKYNNTTSGYLTIRSKYSIGNTEYSTIIENNEQCFIEEPLYNRVDTIIVEDGVIWNGNASRAFQACKNLKNIEFGEVNYTGTEMTGMFSGCSNLQIVRLNNASFNNVTNIGSLFNDCSSLQTIDLTNVNFSNVTNVSDMFNFCTSLSEINFGSNKWENVTNMSRMFAGCKAIENLNLTEFNTSKVTDMNSMFYACTGLKSIDIQTFDTSKVTNMSHMFDKCYELISLDLSSFDTSNVTNMKYMFAESKKLENINLSTFNTSNVTNMSYMFEKCYELANIDLGTFNTSNVIDMSYMFENCTAATNINVSTFDTSKVTNMERMFSRCSSLNKLDLNSFDMSNVTNLYDMLKECRFAQIVTPKVGRQINLPYTMYNEFGTEYTQLPENSITLYKTKPEVEAYTVTLKTNGGTINSGNITSYIPGTEVTLPTNVTKSGYTFEGWYANSNFSGNTITKIASTETGNKTYYAKWTQNAPTPTQTYTVKYNANGGTGSMSDTTHTVGEAAKLRKNTFTKIGYTFKGWSKNSTEATATYADEEIVKGLTAENKGTVTLYAIWEVNTYTVTFKDGQTIAKTETVSHGASAVAPIITKKGYVLRWDKAFNNVTSDLTVNAIWLEDTDEDGIPDIEDDDTKIPYKVEHYIQNTDLTTYTLQETETTLTGNLGDIVTAVAKQYQGFSENTNHTDRIPTGTVVEDGSLILKLYYDRNTYTVTFNTNGGTINDPNNITEYTYGIGGMLPTDVTKEGYTFGGWYDNAELTGNAILQITNTDVENKTYYASWIAKGNAIYKVLHYKQEDIGYILAETDNLTAQIGANATAIPKDYIGYVENTNIAERIPSGIVLEDGSLELKLYYDKINYTVVFKDEENVLDTQTVNYGESAVAPTPTKEGYILSWDKEFNNVTSNLEVNAIWTKISEQQRAYKLEHYIETKEGKYILKETENLVGDIGDIVTAKAKVYEEYILDETNKDTVKQGEIEEDKELVLKLYYKYKRFTIIFKDGNKEVGRQEVIYGGTANPPVLTKQGYILSWDKDINNITTDQTISAVWTKDPNYKDPNAGNNKNDGKEEQKPSILPKTGEEIITLGTMITLLGIAIIYFIKYKF